MLPVKLRSGLSLIGVLTATAILIVAGFVAIPILLRSRRYSNDVAAVQAMAALQRAEKDLYANDLDGNGKADYWMRDVRGLTQIKKRDSTIGLIEESLALADATYGDARPLHDYLFLMVQTDEKGQRLADATGFGPRLIFCMYPTSYVDDRKTSVYDIDEAWWTLHNGGRPIRQWIRFPPSQGWAKTD